MNAFSFIFRLRQFQAFEAIFRWVSGATAVVMSETPASINIIFVFSQRWGFYYSFGYCKRESSSLFFVGFIVVVEEIYTSVAFDSGDIFWSYNISGLLSSACWLLFSLHHDSQTFFSLSLRLVLPLTDTFIKMLVMVFSHIGLVWTRSLNFRFRFLPRKKETDHRIDVLIEVFARQKT